MAGLSGSKSDSSCSDRGAAQIWERDTSLLFVLVTMPKKFNYGGQAVLEGVMIRGQTHMAVSVRRRDGGVSTRCVPLASLYVGKLRELPLVRGIIVLAETLALGMQALSFSANVALESEDQPQAEKQELPAAALWGMVGISLAIAVAIFFVGPLLIMHFLDRYIASSIVSNIVEGAIRLAFFVVYLEAMGFMPDMRRVFAYHGAEHMTISAHENGVPLDVDKVRKFSTLHPRCGTAFLLVVMVIAVVVFAFLGRPPLWIRTISMVALIPVITALSYEVIRFNAAHGKNVVMRWLVAPSLALQVLTTRRPDDAQIEVAISALQAALKSDGVGGEARIQNPGDVPGKPENSTASPESHATK